MKKASSSGPGGAVKNEQCSKEYHVKDVTEDRQTVDIYEKLIVSYKFAVVVKLCNVVANSCNVCFQTFRLGFYKFLTVI